MMARNFFDDPDGANMERYGTGVAGNPSQWKAAYDDRMGRNEAEAFMGGEKYRHHGTPEQAAIVVLAIKETIITGNVIKMAFRKMVFKVHPDHGGTDELFIEVKAAYSLLMDLYGD